MSAAENPIADRRVAFLGKLGTMTKREAFVLIRRLGGVPVDAKAERIDLLIHGIEDEILLPSDHVAQVPSLTEIELWRLLGVAPDAEKEAQLYTPAKVARLIGAPTSAVRRWQRQGWLMPMETVHRLPYYSFEELTVAKRLAQLMRSGATLKEIRSQIEQLRRHLSDGERPLSHSNVVVDGKRLLLRSGDELLEPSGQKRLSLETTDEGPVVHIAFPVNDDSMSNAAMPLDQLIAAAEACEDQGDWATAADHYRSALAAYGANADHSFALAECLYQQGELAAARERYSIAVELDREFVEARANLGCILAELGETDLAIAALQGALSLESDYADAHLHLSRLYELQGNPAAASEHRKMYDQLAPASPWETAEPRG